MNLDRRSVLRGLIFAAAAPAIVRVASLMPVKAWAPTLPQGMTIEKLLRAREILRRANEEFYRPHMKIACNEWMTVQAMRRTGELRISRILPTELYRA